MQVFKLLTIIKVQVICIQSESGLHQPMKAKVGLIGDVLANCAASISLILITHQYIGATNYLALIYWCCKHTQNPRNLIIGAEC